MENTTDQNQQSAAPVQGEELNQAQANLAASPTSESLLEKAKDEVKEIIGDVKDSIDKAEEKVEEVFDEVKDFVEGKKSDAPVEDGEADDNTEENTISDEDAGLTDLKQESNPDHDSATANGGQITNLPDSGAPIDNEPDTSQEPISQVDETPAEDNSFKLDQPTLASGEPEAKR